MGLTDSLSPSSSSSPILLSKLIMELYLSEFLLWKGDNAGDASRRGQIGGGWRERVLGDTTGIGGGASLG